MPATSRGAFLEQACADDKELQAEVLRMLAADSSAGEELASRIPAVPSGDEPEGVPGMSIGPYQLDEEAGRGGMGSVWRAHRIAGGFEQSVAIKLIKRGMDSREVLRRFSQERKILAMLDHPNIARFFDGGIAPDGRPYLAMEFVEGEPLLDYCAQRSLPVRSRLLIFLTICEAVQHAHRHLVIHRDLKPGNILVRATGEVKLLDFGIAKILEPSADETLTGFHMHTPDYASPEQAAGSAMTTASDIYSLGRVFSALLAESPAAADTQAIAAKATREEPEKRYQTVEQLSEDVRCFLTGRPVGARSGALSYRLGKFARRNALPVAAAVALSALILGGLGYVSWQNRRIQLERDRAETTSRFLRELFAAADPERNQGNRLTTRELLEVGAVRVREVTGLESRTALIETIAEAFFNLGLYERAATLYRELVTLEPDRARLAIAWAMLAEAEAFRGLKKESEDAGQKAVALSSGLPSGERAKVLLHRCNQLHQIAQHTAALDACKEASANAMASSALSRAELSSVSIGLGTALMEVSRFSDAEAALLQAVRQAEPSKGELVNSTAAQALSALGSLYFRQGKFVEAETAFRRTLEFDRKLYPDGHLEVARGLNNLANTLATARRQDEAIPLYIEAHGLYRKFLGPESSDLASSLSNLAVAYSVSGRLAEAEQIGAAVVRMQARTIGPGKLPHISSQIKYGAILLERGKTRQGTAVLEDALASLAKIKPAPKLQEGYTRVLLAQGMLDSGQTSRARALATEAEATLQPLLRPGHWMLQQNSIVMGGVLARSGKPMDSSKLLQPVVAANEKKSASGWWVELARRYYREAGGAAQWPK